MNDFADYKSERRSMSKQNRTRAITALTGGVCLILLAITVRVGAARQQGIAAASPAASKSAAVLAATDEVLKETSQVRQLSILRPVKSGAQSREEIRQYITTNLTEENSPQRLHASEVEMKKLGLVPPTFDLRGFLVKVLTEQVAGYYNAKKREFFLADWIDIDAQKPVMAHELTHALQDQHFDLTRFENWPKGESDSELAFHALVEGDATLTMTLYMSKNPARAFAFLKSLAATGTANSQEIDNAPRALRESLLFPYQQGLQWVAQVQKSGGWDGVSRAFTNLPQSSEQILHIEKYFSHEAPVKLAMPDVSKQLGSDWKRIDYDVNGEWSYYLILDQFLKSDNESKRASEGWGGDRYAVYENSRTGEAVIMQMSQWDTEQDAVEFFNAYAKRTARRYGQLQTVPSKESQEMVRQWTTGEGTVFLERRGNRVVVIEGVSDASRIPALRSKLWS
jgi:hypothetical protein